MESGDFENFIDGKKVRLLVDDHTGIRRNRAFAIGECIEGIHCHLRRHPGSNFHLDLDFLGRVIDHLLDLDFPAIVGLNNGVHQRGSIHAIGNVFDEDGRFIFDFHAGSDPHLTATSAALILLHVDHTTRGKIW